MNNKEFTNEIKTRWSATWKDTCNHMAKNPGDFINDDRSEIVAETVDALYQAEHKSWVELVDTARDVIDETGNSFDQAVKKTAERLGVKPHNV